MTETTETQKESKENLEQSSKQVHAAVFTPLVVCETKFRNSQIDSALRAFCYAMFIYSFGSSLPTAGLYQANKTHKEQTSQSSVKY